MFSAKRFAPVVVAALTVVGPVPAAQATGTSQVKPGHSYRWAGKTSQDHHFSHAQFIPEALPTSGRLRLGIFLRQNGSAKAVARAAVDSRGRLFVDILNAAGNTVATKDTGTVIAAGERIFVEAAMLGGNPGKVTVRAWKRGQVRPAWQLVRWSVAVGSTSGSTRPYAYLSGSANAAITVRQPVFWVRSAPFVDGKIGGTAIKAGAQNHVVTSSRSATFFTVGGDCSLNGARFRACGGGHGTEVNLKNLSYGKHTLRVRNQGTGKITSVTWHVRPNQYGSVKPHAGIAGVPSGMALKVMTGAEDGRDDGILKIDTTRQPHLANLDGKHIKARVQIVRGRVNITRSRIEPSGRFSSDADSRKAFAVFLSKDHARQASLKISDSSIHFANNLIQDHPYSGRVEGIRGGNITAERVHIFNVVDGIGVRGNTMRVHGSLIDRAYEGRSVDHSDRITHNDGIQFHEGNNAGLVGNTITGYRNAAIMIKPNAGDILNSHIGRNWLDGGSCTINEAPKSPNRVYGLQIVYNRFGMNNKLTPGSRGSVCISKDVAGVLNMSSGYYIAGNTRTDKSGARAQLWNSATRSLVGR